MSDDRLIAATADFVQLGTAVLSADDPNGHPDRGRFDATTTAVLAAQPTTLEGFRALARAAAWLADPDDIDESSKGTTYDRLVGALIRGLLLVGEDARVTGRAS